MKPRKNPNFRIKGEIVISIKNQEFFYISDDETDFTVGIVWRNLATTSNFVEFRDSQNFTFFEAPGVVQDTWHIVSGSRGGLCHVQNESNMNSNGTHERHVATCEWVKIHGR